ncbi:retrovirus-related Pol polyprotein from transposon gypsy [Trichonephila clavipes]|nr:retrovirus-related Pol polyprotein from transposon gypsy [Trichonephila clavipes]
MNYYNANNEDNINVKNNEGLDQVPDSPEADLKRLFNPAMVVEDTVPKQINEQWEDLAQLLDKFQTIFSQNKNSQQESKEIQTQIEKLLKAGFIRPSHSPYAAPVTLAYKKDEGKRSRLCIDYRKLNEITRKDSSPVPLIDFVIDNLTHAKFFSTLGLTSGYWHIKIHEKDAEKLAFTTNFGLYEWCNDRRRIAPLVIDAQSNATELLDQIGKLCDTPLEGRFENGKLRVFPTSAEEHRLIQKYISDKKLRYHTFEMAHNKQLKVVLRGLPTDFNQEELMSELHSFGFQPNHISSLRNRKTNTNMPLFLVTLPKNPENKGIFNIKTIGFFRVAVEPLNKSTMPPSVIAARNSFITLGFCARAPKCLKCSCGHLTSECTKSAKAPAKCANCSGPHPANFSGCPKNPINTKPTKTKPTKNVWQERAAARKENKQSTPSFAEVVKGTKNNALDAKDVMSQMAQMMTQWGQMLFVITN